ncbi:M23 family peptidase [Pantoea sp. B9002]|uniref:M23 family metallopeptidase n=1 Tax=Pantoea sp. B9002 TaxID=2726979 RepID=UPI0015A3CE85|nr:M23 family metallopeptidase [Pantoea sp. B9002]NWA63826.1 M23 family peptidase [Pantoea sp. B9002]
MIISPPILKAKSATETDAAWISRVMASDVHRSFPVSAAGSWHGGIHIKHTDNSSSPEKVRAIADGKVVSFRTPANDEAKCAEPLNLNGATDNGYVLLKHETEIGSGENGKVVFYSLYMHLKSLNAAIKSDALIYRKDALGTAGMVDGENAFHFQIFCDDDNIEKLTGRKTQKLDITRDGRTDAVYGDIHFVLPVGTKFYNKTPENNSTATEGLSELHTSTVPLYASMTLAKGSCTVVTRQEDENVEGRFFTVGEALIDVDEKEYEYNLYKTAKSRYKNCPSAGYELLRFGRVINVDHEKLVPEDAPLWLTINYSGGQGVVNLATDEIKKFSDADFPHWTGWQMVDDDKDTSSQCNSGVVKKNQDDGLYDEIKDKLICHFPFEWDEITIETRYSWLKNNDKDHLAMKDEEYEKFKSHVKKLCFNIGGLPSGRLWSFNGECFIRNFKQCSWLSHNELSSLLPRKYYEGYPGNPIVVTIPWETSFGRWTKYYEDFNYICNKYGMDSSNRKAAFLGQIYIETGMLRTMTEGGKGKKNSKGKYVSPAAEYYQPFYGRGFMQLTWPKNYSDYRKFRTTEFLPDVASDYSYEDSRISRASSHYWADPRRKSKDKKTGKTVVTIDDDLLSLWYPFYDPNEISDNSFSAVDSAGFYWISKHHSKSININRVSDKGLNSENIGRCSVLVNGGDYGYFERQAYTRFCYYYLNDEIRDVYIERLSISKGRNSIDVTIDYTKQREV